ncbi:hypothetical protein ALC56_04014 [Trachymyrmex septentrionalis]|uniref:Double jelly roll-like domain-containing protein n=1 Tax=Trachymyrmex septentrionalis TaxID=34720 RepID=A0A151JYU2_9HYME|nr:hypothetical protein ALC56_04014 [Trachymyrmex septentrionalis]
MTDILNIKDEPIFDDRIVKIETHAYNPFANTTFGYSDEIRILIQNLDFDKNRCAILYDFYTRFCKDYYGYEYLEPSLTFTTFLRNGPFMIIDCSRQNESVKSGTVDVRLDFECKENVPAKTTAYCLIIHDRVVQYNPLTNVVCKIT